MKRLFLVFFILTMTVPAIAKDITLIAGLSLPPYIIQESDKGMEHDVIKEALATKGHTLKLKYVPFARVVADYDKYDGAITINESSGIIGNYSDVVMVYRNFAISLKDNEIKINSVEDLKDKTIVAFQNATKYLGPRYAKIVEENPKYSEQAKQVLQVKMLYSGRATAIISDINIFNFYKKMVKDMDTSATIVLHKIFKGTSYKVLFNDAAIRDDFNAGLSQLKTSGRYEQIIRSYIQ
ncbi:MAG: transporter substrate-binding domain-containing protein [Proteobacteria bacterium]|nr:transporter substrate-binding domain-containing protein [Pseudomonadota bacterium]MBU1581685.1 transporter substrate-binding domain-containing protein [Pseudomonadota bacterium]MBU2452546.1 transporter substrate-binding domain-containing protein [Pseudomonadota bacterium]MBU2627914.1 transporter substrate-binding domain-containing protein [Pseudomonadota bacterium]